MDRILNSSDRGRSIPEIPVPTGDEILVHITRIGELCWQVGAGQTMSKVAGDYGIGQGIYDGNLATVKSSECAAI